MTCLISNASLQPPVYDRAYTAILIRVIPNQHFKSTLLGGGEGVTKKSTLCTLVKMMTIMDDPLQETEKHLQILHASIKCVRRGTSISDIEIRHLSPQAVFSRVQLHTQY